MRLRACVLLALFSASFVFTCFSARPAPLAANLSTAPGVVTQKLPQPDLPEKLQRDRDDPPAQLQRDRDDPLWHASARVHTVGKNLGYGGGPVMTGTTHLYAIFWEPTRNVSDRYNSLIKRFLREVGHSSFYHIARQYKQANGHFPVNAVLAASWLDSRAYPESPVLDNDIQHEVTHAQRVNGWHSSQHSLFIVFTERKQNVCMDSKKSACISNGFCAYHSAFGTNTIYAAIPYIASFHCDPTTGPNHDDADKTITGVSHEEMEAATDPFGDGWIDSQGNEIADKCVQNFGRRNAQGANVVWKHDFYLIQGEWDNQTHSCRLAPVFRHAKASHHYIE